MDSKKTLEINNKNKEDSVNNSHNKNTNPILFCLKENEVMTKVLKENSDLKNNEINKEIVKTGLKSESLKLFNIDSNKIKSIIYCIRISLYILKKFVNYSFENALNKMKFK